MGKLILSRKRNETIEFANGAIVIDLVEIRGDRARIGVQAPRNIQVDRGEVAEAKRRSGDQPLGVVQVVDAAKLDATRRVLEWVSHYPELPSDIYDSALLALGGDDALVSKS